MMTAEDYAKLQDRSLDKVALSNGTTIGDRQPIWYDQVLPNHEKVGDRCVLVTTVGTAHYCGRWMGTAMPLMVLAVVGLFFTVWNLRLRRAAGAK